MKIGVFGSGDVAKALAGGFVKHGHQVVLGTRDAAKLADWVVQHGGAQTGALPMPRNLRNSWFSQSRGRWR